MFVRNGDVVDFAVCDYAGREKILRGIVETMGYDGEANEYFVNIETDGEVYAGVDEQNVWKV